MSDERAAEQQAFNMLDCFASVGARRFDVTLTNRQGNKLVFRRGVGISNLRSDLPRLLKETRSQEQNLILRPCPPPVFLQLDDLNPEGLQRVQPVSFLQMETSPGNGQAWLALTQSGAQDGAPALSADFARRVRKATGADPTASGATRVAGSFNFKEKHAPHFPQVKILHTAGGLTVTPAQLEELGFVVAAPEPETRPARQRSAPRPSRGKSWPSYERCLRDAPAKNDHSGPDTSRADFTWALIALDWGWSLEATTTQLMELSTKAKAEGQRYAERTVQRAAEALARRHNQPHNGP